MLTTYTDKQNLNLLIRINKSRQLHLVPCTLNGNFVLRLSVNYEFTTPELISECSDCKQTMLSYLHMIVLYYRISLEGNSVLLRYNSG